MDEALGSFRLNPDHVTPLYIQLANTLGDAIQRGHWRAREALPSERMLAGMLGISRVTARNAIDLLCERGILQRVPCSGTYIAPRPEQPVEQLTAGSEEWTQRGATPDPAWLEHETGSATPLELLALGLSPTTAVVRLKRLRTAGDLVMAIETSTLPAAYVPDPAAVSASLYAYLEARGAAPVRTLQHIRAVNATSEQARLVGIDRGMPMLHITRVSYLANGAAVELTHSYFRSDHYAWVAESQP